MRQQSLLQHLNQALIMSFLLALGVLAHVPAPAHAQLDILLTNDDGFGQPGIEALKMQLRAAGHTVTVGAPDGNSSGAASSLDLIRPIVQVECLQRDECKVREVCFSQNVTQPDNCPDLAYLGPATPAISIAATAAAVGKDLSDFDLVISGINNGVNLGPETQFSGTVGAMIAAITKLGGDIPGIAVSMPTDLVNATVDDAASFIVTVVQQLEANQGLQHDKLLPDGVGLSINYPDLARGDLAGVKLTVQGRLGLESPGQLLVFREVAIPNTPMLFAPSRLPVPTTDIEVRNADTTAFNQGFITITPIEADDTVSRKARRHVGRLLRPILRK